MIKELHIDITQQLIENSVKSSMCRCPIALATNRKLNPDGVYPFVTAASVGLHEATFEYHEQDKEPVFCKFAMPQEATAFIEARDRGEEVQPFEFTVQPKQYKRKMAH